MVADARGTSPMFNVVTTPEHSRIRADFGGVQLLHDPNEVQDFVLEYPFCVEALLVLADICRSSGEHEQAFHLTRRAVYAVECNFDAGFSPFLASDFGDASKPLVWPRVRLTLPEMSEPTWPGWPWLAAIWAHMLGLASRGMNRTAVEVYKFLLSLTLPRDPVHALAHLDYLCLRAGEHDLLVRLARDLVPPFQKSNLEGSEVTRLDLVLPNFAYSAALAGHLSAIGGRGAKALEADETAALRNISVGDVLAPCLGSVEALQTGAEGDEEYPSQPHVALMRAMLLFPHVLRPLLSGLSVALDAPAPKGSPYGSTWAELLERRPLVASTHVRHERHFLVHALVADAYASRCAPLWRGEPALRWLHSCAGRLAQMSESTLFDGELMEARRQWSQARFRLEPALTIDYKEFSSSEVGSERRAPAVLEHAMNSLSSEAAIEAAMEQRLSRPSLGHGDATAAILAGGAGNQGDDFAALMRALRSYVGDQASESGADPPAADIGAGGGAEGFASHGESEGEQALAQLVEMGFSASEAKEALESAGGDIAAAIGSMTS